MLSTVSCTWLRWRGEESLEAEKTPLVKFEKFVAPPERPFQLFDYPPCATIHGLVLGTLFWETVAACRLYLWARSFCPHLMGIYGYSANRVRGDFVRRSGFFFLILMAVWLGISSLAFAGEKRLIAVVMVNSQQRYQNIHDVFVDSLRASCADDCRIYVQTPNADIMSLRNGVRKAVALGADLIITYGTTAALAARAEVPPVPTLFADVYEPVSLGLVSDKSYTGRNMTGVRGDAPIQTLFKYFTETTQVRKLAVVYDGDSQEGNLQKAHLEESGGKKGIVVVAVPIGNGKEQADDLKTLPADVDGIFMACGDYTESQLLPLLTFAAARRLPVMTQHEGSSEKGAFMVLETSSVEQGKKLAEMADQVLSGKKTHHIPLYIPHQVAFVVNLKIAREYGLQVPLQVLSVATRVVR